MVSGLTGNSGNSGIVGFYNPGSAGATHQWAARLQSGLNNNDSLSQFTDSVGTLHPTATGTGLLYLTNQINGLPAVSFASTAQAFLGGAIGLSGNPACAVIMVASSPSGTLRRLLQFGSSSGNAGAVKSYTLNSPAFRSLSWNRQFNPPSDSAGWHIFVGFNASGATVNEHRYLADGIELTQSSSGNGTSVPDIGNEETIIGAQRGSGGGALTNYFNGSVAEIVIVNSASTNLINYHGRQLARIYNLSWTDFAG